MALPVNIEKLIHGEAVEWERLEFKKGWNPEEVTHTICAFANDINNWGGGYIIVGIEAIDGRPVLPPTGIAVNSIDKIQKEILEICHKIQPHYLPAIQPCLFNKKHILVIWVPAGDLRPYTAPSTLGKKSERRKFIRFGSSTIVAKGQNERRLDELTARIPFDDRINQNASVDDLDLGLIQSYLKQIKSDLYEESKTISFIELCRKMNIAKGPDEFLRPVNVGLMFFNQKPEMFFDRAFIEVVIRKDDFGKEFIEEKFTGPLNIQLRNALDYINRNVVRHEVRKVDFKPEALRLTNYPETAIEEALANAVYHKGYDYGSSIEVQVFPDKITILSYPGPVPPIDQDALKQRNVVARNYRNRRIGDFLKDLDLTEGKGTGFPLIYKSMENNGSPLPEFETDAEHTYFLTTLRIHPAFLKSTAGPTDKIRSATDITINDFEDILTLILSIEEALYKEGTVEYDKNSDRVSDRVNQQIFNRIVEFLSNNGQFSDRVGAIVSDRVGEREKSKMINTLELCIENKSRTAIFANLGLRYHYKNYKKYIEPLINNRWLKMTMPDNPSHPNQQYGTTLQGAILLCLIKQL
ncbi:MAG: putative DNA binding domain-containing protein [Bacteroidia bacterium]|nr:putative DNA binding domain-containing protein [Bacteroidia bacterium]